MNIRNLGAGLLAAMTLSTMLVVPLTAAAQRGWDRDWQDRRDDDRDWNGRRNKERNEKARRDNARDWNERRDESRDWNGRRDNDRSNRDSSNRDRRDQDRYRNDRDDWQDNRSDRRQKSKNEWRNIAIGAGAVGVLGLLKKDRTLTFAGGAGALYSLYRYEQDRRSQSQLDRARAEYFSRPYFYRDGVQYERQIVTRDGEQCYQFARR